MNAPYVVLAALFSVLSLASVATICALDANELSPRFDEDSAEDEE